jgi:hypothetical protein
MGSTYDWKQEGVIWRRRLGSMESFYLTQAAAQGQPVHMMIEGCMPFKCEDPTVNVKEAILEAWKSIRFDFPNIVAEINTRTCTIEVNTPQDHEVYEMSLWLQRPFKTHERVSTNKLFTEFNSQYHITLQLIQEVDSSCLMLHVLFNNLGRQGYPIPPIEEEDFKFSRPTLLTEIHF